MVFLEHIAIPNNAVNIEMLCIGENIFSEIGIFFNPPRLPGLYYQLRFRLAVFLSIIRHSIFFTNYGASYIVGRSLASVFNNYGDLCRLPSCWVAARRFNVQPRALAQSKLFPYLLYCSPCFIDLLGGKLSIEEHDSDDDDSTDGNNPIWPAYLLFVLAFFLIALGYFIILIMRTASICRFLIFGTLGITIILLGGKCIHVGLALLLGE